MLFWTVGKAIDTPFQFNITLSVIDFSHVESYCPVKSFYNQILHTKLHPQVFPDDALGESYFDGL